MSLLPQVQSLSKFKQAVVISLLKKLGPNTNDLKQFTPVSNLPFVSKVLEKVVPRQLQKYVHV